MDSINQLLPRDKEYPVKCDEYMCYINNHKERVITAYNMYFRDNLAEMVKGIINDDGIKLLEDTLNEKIPNHDMSKYSDEEFEGYRLSFYPTDIEKEIMEEDETAKEYARELFQDAWKHHQQVNSHHPHYFLWNEFNENTMKMELLETPLEKPSMYMGIENIIEMICDWSAMSKGENDFNYIYWLSSDDSKDEREIMCDDTKRVLLTLTFRIFPTLSELEKEQLENLLGVKPEEE